MVYSSVDAVTTGLSETSSQFVSSLTILGSLLFLSGNLSSRYETLLIVETASCLLPNR